MKMISKQEDVRQAIKNIEEFASNLEKSNTKFS